MLSVHSSEEKIQHIEIDIQSSARDVAAEEVSNIMAVSVDQTKVAFYRPNETFTLANNKNQFPMLDRKPLTKPGTVHNENTSEDNFQPY